MHEHTKACIDGIQPDVCVSALTLSGQQADTAVQPQAPFDVSCGTINVIL